MPTVKKNSNKFDGSVQNAQTHGYEQNSMCYGIDYTHKDFVHVPVHNTHIHCTCVRIHYTLHTTTHAYTIHYTHIGNASFLHKDNAFMHCTPHILQRLCMYALHYVHTYTLSSCHGDDKSTALLGFLLKITSG